MLIETSACKVGKCNYNIGNIIEELNHGSSSKVDSVAFSRLVSVTKA